MRTASERADEDDEKVKEKVRKEWIDDSGNEFWCGGWCTRGSNFKFLDVTWSEFLYSFTKNKCLTISLGIPRNSVQMTLTSAHFSKQFFTFQITFPI